MRYLGAVAAAAMALSMPAQAIISFGGVLAVPGNAVDLAPGSTANDNRLSFRSDMVYHAGTDTYYGVSDRGPAGGTINFAPRIEAFKLNISSSSGAIINFHLTETKVLRQANGTRYSGLFPDRLPGGSKTALGNALDSEGIARFSNGQFLVSDEYGPRVLLMSRDGRLIRAFTTPANLVPCQPDTTVNYVDGRPTTTTGRQDNRGFEGITLSGDGAKAWAIMQDPLLNDGAASGEGRRSTNLRIVEFNVATGLATSQFVYQLEGLAAINGRILGTANDFGPAAQGRNIGVSSITWIGGSKFLVIERDNRGEGPDNLVAGAPLPVGSKRIYMIDIASALTTAGQVVPEKFEGLAIGPRLDDGFALMLATDNDFSVTQNGGNVQFDVCHGAGSPTRVALGTACPANQSLVPSRLYSFKISGADAANFSASLFSVPEPASWAMLIAGFGLTGAALRRRRALVV